MKEAPFIAGKLLSSTLLRCLFFNITQIVILENLSVLDLGPSGVKRLSQENKLFTPKGEEKK